MVPLEDFAELFKAKLDWGWNNYTNTLYINSVKNAELSPVHPESYPSQGHEHNQEKTLTFSYNSNPPTSGPHDEVFPDSFITKAPMEVASLVHMLEHGNIVIAYNHLSTSQLEQLVSWVNEKNENVNQRDVHYAEQGTSVFLMPWPTLPDGVISAMAWTKKYSMNSLNLDQLEMFRKIWLFNLQNMNQ